MDSYKQHTDDRDNFDGVQLLSGGGHLCITMRSGI